jgi:predicted CoA-binding protein
VRGNEKLSMVKTPESVTTFLRGRRFAVAGVSRQPGQAANAVFRKLRDAGYETFPINPKAKEVEGVKCYGDVGSVPGHLDGVVIATAPDVSAQIVRECSAHDVRRVWFHRSLLETAACLRRPFKSAIRATSTASWEVAR